MPRRGGESDKLGNRYEGVWTVDNLLDVLAGSASSITVEPLGEDSFGVEFIKELSTGQKEFHSAKRQTTEATWTISQLISGNANSILGRLFQKLQNHQNSRVVFVSGTTANQLYELTEQASRLKTLKVFQPLLAEAQWRQKEFDLMLPLCDGRPDILFDFLTRTNVIGETEGRLIHEVEQRIRADISTMDGSETDAHVVRLLLADLVFEWFQQPITKKPIEDYLAAHGYRVRDIARDKSVLALISKRNSVYTSHVEAELILGKQIERPEAAQAHAALTENNLTSRIAIIGAAGLGKSCAVSQTLRLLESGKIPVLAIRLDVQVQALTSDELGKQLGFPVSPAVVLARIARGRRCVLLIDQLDALSFVSGRNQHLWSAFEELLLEAEAVSNMRVLLACRAFDLENDSRLRRLVADQKKALRIDLKLLDVSLVTQTVAKATNKKCNLSEKQLELLRIPVNLNLYLQGDAKSNDSFQTVQDLFARFWEHKRRRIVTQLGYEPKWKEIITRLTNWLSDNQTLSAPLDILDDWEKDARVMASECVLTIDGRSCRFFHETFFDYAFARTFISNGGKIIELLLKGEQHLFRRAQVRQILTYQRDRDRATYLNDLENLLRHPNIRFHIKKLILDWLRILDNPTIEEWEVLKKFNGDAKLGKFIRGVPHNNASWFHVLNQLETWNQWIRSPDENLVLHALWLLGMPNVMRQASDKVAVILSAHVQDTEIWRNRLLQGFWRGGDIFYSPEMFDFFLDKLRAGWFDQMPHYWWHGVVELPKTNPDIAIELIVKILERILTTDTNSGRINFENFGLSAEFLSVLEKNNGEEFLRRVLPQVVALVQSSEFVNEIGDKDDRLGVYHYVGDEHSFKDALFGTLERCIKAVACTMPENFESLVAPYEKFEHRTVAILLLTGWAANAPRFADKAINFILQNSHRFALGYFAWGGGGTGQCAITRAVLKATAPHCSKQNFERLEQEILAYKSPFEKKNVKSIGYYQMLLLEALPKKRMSSKAKLQLERLMGKFPKMDFSPPQPSRVFSVGSPIPAEATKKMTDKNWISAMKKYSPDFPRTPENWSKGGGFELASTLRVEAQRDKPRFAKLALQMSDKIPSFYFGAILDGITETHGVLPEDNLKNAKSPQPLDTDTIFDVLRRVHNLAGHPCGRNITSGIYHLDKRKLPDDAYQILNYYALNDLDPTEESWQKEASAGRKYYNGDPLSAGINTVRGGAADAVARLLFADIGRWPKLEATVRALAVDKSLAVRSVVLHCLLALMNRDRDLAVELFLQLTNGAEAILGAHSVDEFIHYAVYSHYAKVRPILISMLQLEDEKARASAARQIAVAAFHNGQAEEDLKHAMAGDEHCRDAIAGVFSHNLGNEPVRTQCREKIIPLFNDESEKVRKTADNCFRNLSPQQLTEERDLIFAFIESRAFIGGFDQLVYSLKESTALLPDVTCAIPEKIVSEHLKQTPNQSIEQHRMVYGLPELVVRLYEQTPDSDVKTRCLNCVDSMLELGMGTLETELNKIER